MTNETPPARAKPLFATDVACPACGSKIGLECRRKPRGLSYTVAMPTPCYARTAKLRKALGLKGNATRPIEWRS